MHGHTKRSRRGAIVPLTALCLTILLGFVALALDLGLLMTARNQCQNAADSAAMAGARTLTGDPTTNNNYNNATPNANAAAAANNILNTPINPPTQVVITVGDYYYDTTSSSFKVNPTSRQSGDNWTLVQATVTSQQSSLFAWVFGMNSLNASATATAAHRPRDTVIVVDFSGSMRFESLLGYPYFGNRTVSMNADTVYPTFGQYNGNSSQLIYSADQTAPHGEIISAANTAVATLNAPTPVITAFYADTAAFGTTTPAFTSASSAYATTPNGDVPLKTSKGSGSSYAQTVSAFLGGTTTRDWRFELDGYSAYSGGGINSTTSTATDYSTVPFNGYTQGPGYWGKTFMVWPPDPRVPVTTTAPIGCSAGAFTPPQDASIVKQFLSDFGYTAADFANTSVTTLTSRPSTTATTLMVPASTAALFPSAVPFKIMIGTTSGGAFTTSPAAPEVVSVTAIGSTSNGTTAWTVSRPVDGTTASTDAMTNPSANFNASTTSITVSSNTGFPTTSLPFQIMVGTVSSGVFTTPEIMTVTAVSGTTWTVTRGVAGTTKSAGTTSMTVGLVSTVGLWTGPPLYGIYTAASTNISATVGTTPSTSSVWNSWTASTLSSFLTTNVYQPGSGSLLTSSSAQYQQTMRLYNRVGTGMPKDGSGNPVPCDWRARFFTTPGGAPLMDDSKLWSSGTRQLPSSTTYLINYTAILDWIKNSGTNPFPAQLRAGGIIYYSSIPSTINTTTFPPPDPNQRFWKEYIDEVLGFQQTGGSGSSPTYQDVGGACGYGDDIAWGTVATSGLPSGWPTSTYISYTDNPNRPLLRGWFGPLTLVDFIGNYNVAADPSNSAQSRLWWPGTVPEAPTYQTKLGIQGALTDTLRNHPNDNVALVFFSSPKSSATGSGATGYYNLAAQPLGRNERAMINSLWFSPKTNNTNGEINIYDSSGNSTGDIYTVPRANGGTCYSMPLMLAYNQFSVNSNLINYTANAPAGTAGGLGRTGAAKLLVFETDGCVNTGASANLVSSSNATGYYQVRVADANNYGASGTEFPSNVTGVTFSAGATQSQNIATQICADVSAGGFSTSRKPVKVHCIAFGSLFESTNTSVNKTNALNNLAQLEVIGSVQPAGATTLASNKIIVGDFNTRINNLQSAFSSIMQDGIQVALVSSGPGLP
jgi:Flp pilus assembly protein TadG